MVDNINPDYYRKGIETTDYIAVSFNELPGRQYNQIRVATDYFEEKKFIDKCPFCGNKDKEQTNGIFPKKEVSINQL